MIERIEQTPIMHRVVKQGGVLYLGGVTAPDLSANFRGQTEQILRRIESLLDQHGSSKHKVLRATIFLKNFADKKVLNQVWTEFFPADALPARATIGVAELGESTLIEVVATASI